jgi:hypothetical protein
VAPQEPGGSAAAASVVVPGVEFGCALPYGVGSLHRVEQVLVLVEAEVFAHHRQA